MTNQLLDKPMAVCGELIECQGTANALGWHKKKLFGPFVNNLSGQGSSVPCIRRIEQRCI
jgi:hypothetical protein